MNKTKPKRKLWPDVIRSIAIFLVIVTHTGINQNKNNYQDFWATIIFSSIDRAAVPLFVLLSGALLLKKSESYLSFFKKRVTKVFIPWVIWSLIYVIWNCNLHSIRIEDLSQFLKLFYITFMSQFWFLPMLSVLYVLTPILRIFIKNSNKLDILYFIFVWFIFVSLIPFLINFYTQAHLSIPYSIQHLGYYVGGFYIITFNKKKNIFKTSILFLLFLTLNILGSYFFNDKYQVFNSNSAPFIFGLSITAFAFLYQTINKNLKPNRLLQKLITSTSKASFGIFFVHIIIMDVFNSSIYKLTTSFSPFLYIPTRAIIIFMISFLIVNLIKKIPYIQRIIP